MDRLEKIKGYKDRPSKDDVIYLITEVERLRVELGLAEVRDENSRRVAELATTELKKLKGETPEAPCPCNSPTDHAGWCPRR